jgi:hypothetical protein
MGLGRFSSGILEIQEKAAQRNSLARQDCSFAG